MRTFSGTHMLSLLWAGFVPLGSNGGFIVQEICFSSNLKSKSRYVSVPKFNLMKKLLRWVVVETRLLLHVAVVCMLNAPWMT